MNSAPHNRRPKRPKLTRALGATERHIQGTVLDGLLELVPLIVTIVVVMFVVRRADGFVRQLPFVEGEPWDVPGIGLVALIIAFYLFGLLLVVRLGRWIIKAIETVLLHVPVVKVIYRLMLQVTRVVASDYGFSRVVFVEWPREGMIAMGFVTGRVLARNGTHSIVTVYIPTVPNPTSGNMAFVNEDDVMETDLSVDSAMKMVFSGGFVIPDKMSLARVPRFDGNVNKEFIGTFESESAAKARKANEQNASGDGPPVAAVGGTMPKPPKQEKAQTAEPTG